MKIITFEGSIKNAKSYPYWEELYGLLLDHTDNVVTRIADHTPFAKIREMIDNSDVVISIDSFVPHLARYFKCKTPIIVIWGKSDPLHFGYPEHRNLFKDTKYFKPQQFQWWREEKQEEKVWIKPEVIVRALSSV